MDSSQHTPVEQRHLPVLLDTSVARLPAARRRPGAARVDATLGMGGQATAVLDAAPEARLVGIDRDAEALALARERIGRAGHAERATLVHATYDELPEVLEELGLDGADAVMMDLGLSSFHIDTAERGFFYTVDARSEERRVGQEGRSARGQ